MNWHHRASLRRTHSLSGGDIQAKCSFIDIRKNRSCPHIAHRFGRGEKAVGGDDDIVTRLDSRGFQGKFQCRCSIAYADHVLAAKICRKLALESLHPGTANKLGGLQHVMDSFLDLSPNGSKLSLEIDERHFHA